MSTINDFGIPEVGSGILQPKLKHKFRLTFSQLGDSVDGQALSLQVVRTDRPKMSFDEIEVHRYNSRDWVAGKHNWEPLNIVVEDDITGGASKIIRSQVQKQQYTIGAEGQWLASAAAGDVYKFSAELDMLDGGENVLEKWTMESCWFNNIDWGDMDFETSDKVIISLTMRFGHAFQSIQGFDGFGVAAAGHAPGTGIQG
jgi:hypothetical protein